MKKAKCQHLSDIINKNCSSPKTLFNIINATLNPPACLVPGVSSPSCEEFLLLLIGKLWFPSEGNFYAASSRGSLWERLQRDRCLEA